MFSFFRSQSGFSLVQGMVVAGVLAGSSLVATRLLTDQKLAQRSAETRDEIERLHTTVHSFLQDKDNCKAAFAGSLGNNLITGTSPASPSIINLTTIPTPGGDVVVKQVDNLSDSKYMNGHVTISAINAIYPIYNPAQTAIRPGYGRIAIKYKRLSATQDATGNSRSHGSGFGAKDIEKSILIRVQRTGSTFDSCYSVIDDISIGICSLGASYSTQADCNLAGGVWTEAGDKGNNDLIKKFCEELNSQGVAGTSMFIWDEASSTCRPRDNACREAGEVNMGIDSNGMAVCRPLLNVLDLNRVIDNSSATTCPAGSGSPRFEIFTITTAHGPTQRVRIRCN